MANLHCISTDTILCDSDMDRLAHKVVVLKSITIMIGDEVRDQHHLLNMFDDHMSASRGTLGISTTHLETMRRSSGSYSLWLYMLTFITSVFFICYVLIRI